MRDRLIELIKKSHLDWLNKNYDNETDKNVCEYLADELLENGVICPPCKVGDTIYDISEFLDGTNSPEMYEIKVENITITKLNGEIIFEIDNLFMRHSDFGKALFLSKEEAEKALGGV